MEMNGLTPVRLPPGWLRLATRPSLTGSPPVMKTLIMPVPPCDWLRFRACAPSSTSATTAGLLRYCPQIVLEYVPERLRRCIETSMMTNLVQIDACQPRLAGCRFCERDQPCAGDAIASTSPKAS